MNCFDSGGKTNSIILYNGYEFPFFYVFTWGHFAIGRKKITIEKNWSLENKK